MYFLCGDGGVRGRRRKISVPKIDGERFEFQTCVIAPMMDRVWTTRAG